MDVDEICMEGFTKLYEYVWMTNGATRFSNFDLELYSYTP